MATVPVTKPYPCPNPARDGGCGCPRSSSRCYGDIRSTREDFRHLLASGYGREDAAAVVAAQTNYRWHASEILSRF